MGYEKEMKDDPTTSQYRDNLQKNTIKLGDKSLREYNEWLLSFQ